MTAKPNLAKLEACYKHAKAEVKRLTVNYKTLCKNANRDSKALSFKALHQARLERDRLCNLTNRARKREAKC